MIHSPSQERRKHPRFDKNIPVKICGADFDLVTETKNISMAGAYCQTDKHLDVMTRLDLHLLIPLKGRTGIMTKKISCQGVVVRVEPQKDSPLYNVAIFFSDINRSDGQVIRKYIESLAISS